MRHSIAISINSNRATVRNVIKRFIEEQRFKDKPKNDQSNAPSDKRLETKIVSDCVGA